MKRSTAVLPFKPTPGQASSTLSPERPLTSGQSPRQAGTQPTEQGFQKSKRLNQEKTAEAFRRVVMIYTLERHCFF
ncbi:hypothetical protein ACN4EG_10755 [Alkalinema pantanalense CENA528]|uniref:hypothetical protein n=1 Tax=Alkalinema pantanalense TaxID=1620705 RepID=UPI003D6E8273